MLTKTTRREVRLTLALLLALGMIVGLWYGIAYAGAQIDTSFSTDGKLNEDFALKIDEARAVAIQPDGKIVVAGTAQRSSADFDPALARYNPNGNRDTTFGDAGILLVETFGGGADGINSIAMQPDGKIVVAGYGSSVSGPVFAVGRFNSNGTPDLGFGGNRGTSFRGWYLDCESQTCNDNSTSMAYGVAVQPDGKIVAAGWIRGAGGGPDFYLMRFNSNGTPDTNFGTSGKVRTDFFGGVDEARAMVIQPDGLIVAGGKAQVSGSNYDFALARYNSTGRLDNTFGNQGKSNVDFNGVDDLIYSIALQPDGMIVAVGRAFASQGNDYSFAIARYQRNGALDGSFSRGNGDGKFSFGLGTPRTTDEGRGVVVQPDGKIMAVGFATNAAGNSDFAMLSLHSDGTIDFGGLNDPSRIDFAGGNDIANAAALQPDGQLVVVGSAVVRTRNGPDFAIARILTFANPRPTPTSTPIVTPTPTGKPTPPTGTPARTPTPPTDSRFFAETGHSVRGLFLKYWEEHGGLAQQGFPITEELQEKSDTDGKVYTMQYFQRAVFEYHPENQPPFDVLLSLLGVFNYNEKYGGNAPNQRASTTNPRKFAETGKTIGGAFRRYWETHGGLPQQGFPISDEFQEVSQTDGKTYTVQYFQRAVFEFHPEFAGTPNEVLLSLLGVFFHEKKHGVGP